MTWIASASTDEDRVVAAEGGDTTSCSSRTTRGVRRVLQRDREPAALVRAALALGARGRAGARPRDARAWRDGYVAVNAAFAAAVVAQLDNKPDAIVFFHDYHLYLAPRLVRDARPRCAARALRAHPVAGRLSALPPPWREPILDGLARERRRRLPHRALGAQLPSRRAATSARRRVTHHADLGRRRRVRRARAQRRGAREQESVASTRAEKLIVRVDRTDPSKNIVRGFRAFEPAARRSIRSGTGA